LLQWYSASFGPFPAYEAAIERWANFVLNNWIAFNMTTDALPTGFVGLAFADLLQPWVTFPFPT
jgi:hypothetical protein